LCSVEITLWLDGFTGVFFLWQVIADVLEALANMADVLAELWPLDDTARILLRIVVHYNFASLVRDSEAERCKIITEFCDTVLRENASRAVGREPPLSFRQAKERWGDVTERYGPASVRQIRADGGGQQSGGGGGGGTGQSKGGAMVRSRGARFHTGGKQYSVCFDFNKGRCNRQAAGCGCEDKKGVVYAHVCNHYFASSGKYCLAPHPKANNH
jgi:uncharacterized membrane protein YgcG